MGTGELLLVAVGLSMDAFAVALCKGLGMRKPDGRRALIIALFFGGFQAAMPLIGFLLGQQFERYITSVDHWVAFGLLLVIGGKMIYETLTESDEAACEDTGLSLKELLVLSVATSIDALAVGIAFASLKVRIVPSVALIGIATFSISLAGVAIGRRFGTKLSKAAGLAGGAVLILIGLKILLEHLGVI